MISRVSTEYCSVPRCQIKVLDFSADNDQEYDINWELTQASLHTQVPLPESFTVCSAFMVEAWNTESKWKWLFPLSIYTQWK